MKAISIRQPLAWLIVNGFKDIENRSWDTKYRGVVLVHASSRRPTKAEVQNARAILLQTHGTAAAHLMPSADNFQLGSIVGYTHITGTTRESTSPWFFGPVGFQLHGSKPLPFLPMKGRLSFFETGYGLVCAGRTEVLIREFNVPGVNT
ncbi:ASCH domain-containing protein [Leclercia sp.]|uniref:ASCH domain-containing protein n=1 Tax=Leclercia sp. TaxID=1898428 RepID=UPI0028BD3AAB|nr:ASCH domain-containing protein [Leclercia sp.]